MARKLKTSPRKSASQERSRLTVDAILEATTRILLKEGYDRASTNKIAAAAGVSIGSVYQYFPSKEALVAAVIDRHAEKLMHVTRNSLVKVLARPIKVAAWEFVSAAINAHRVEPELHRILAEQIPRIGRLENIEKAERDAYVLIQGYLDNHRDEIDVVDTGLSAFILVTAVEAVTHAAVCHRPNILSDENAEKFVDEVTNLVVRYLQQSRSTNENKRGLI